MTHDAPPAFLTELHTAASVGGRAPFKPFVRYDRAGDYIEFVFKDEEYFEERVDDFLTVYRSEDTRDVIGSVLKGIRRAKAQSSALRVLVKSGRVRLSHFLMWGMETSGDGEKRGDVSTRVYEELLAKAESGDAPAELEMAGAAR